MTFPAVEAFRGGAGLIRIVGHRGARGILPENSMLGFEFSLASDVPLLEFDVVMTADLVPIITHNHRLHSATFRGPDGRFIETETEISDMTWAEIKRFDIGKSDSQSTYGKRFPEQAQINGINVPRLQDLLEYVAQPKHIAAHLMLEIKSNPIRTQDPVYRDRLITIIADMVRNSGLGQRTLMHSFDWGLLAACQAIAPDLPVSFLTQLPEHSDAIGEESSQWVTPDFSIAPETIPQMVFDAGGRIWCPNVRDITPQMLDSARQLGLVVAVWTVNDMKDIDRMIDLGVDAIVTDYPGRVQRRLSDQGIRWMD